MAVVLMLGAMAGQAFLRFLAVGFLIFAVAGSASAEHCYLGAYPTNKEFYDNSSPYNKCYYLETLPQSVVDGCMNKSLGWTSSASACRTLINNCLDQYQDATHSYSFFSSISYTISGVSGTLYASFGIDSNIKTYASQCGDEWPVASETGYWFSETDVSGLHDYDSCYYDFDCREILEMEGSLGLYASKPDDYQCEGSIIPTGGGVARMPDGSICVKVKHTRMDFSEIISGGEVGTPIVGGYVCKAAKMASDTLNCGQYNIWSGHESRMSLAPGAVLQLGAMPDVPGSCESASCGLAVGTSAGGGGGGGWGAEINTESGFRYFWEKLKDWGRATWDNLWAEDGEIPLADVGVTVDIVWSLPNEEGADYFHPGDYVIPEDPMELEPEQPNDFKNDWPDGKIPTKDDAYYPGGAPADAEKLGDFVKSTPIAPGGPAVPTPIDETKAPTTNFPPATPPSVIIDVPSIGDGTGEETGGGGAGGSYNPSIPSHPGTLPGDGLGGGGWGTGEGDYEGFYSYASSGLSGSAVSSQLSSTFSISVPENNAPICWTLPGWERFGWPERDWCIPQILMDLLRFSVLVGAVLFARAAIFGI